MRAPILVMAKAPAAGKSKTRLCPPCTPQEAADIAEASLAQTLEAVAEVDVARRVLVLDGATPSWLAGDVEVIPQRGIGLGSRLASAFADAGTPALAIGMDTPQVTAELLHRAVETLLTPGVDAIIGEASDGGYWAIGLTDSDPSVFERVPMSTRMTYRMQRRRLANLGMAIADLPLITDVDSMHDAEEVARQVPGTRFAESVRQVQRRRFANVS
jgi:rSAM/selenodomain-associated transferase 1